MLRECSPPQTCPMSHVTCHVSHVTCHMSRVTCHVSNVTWHMFCFFLFFFLRTKWWSLSVEGLLSAGPTPSSYFPCSKTICVPSGSLKTHFVFTLDSMFHIFSNLFDSQDLWSHLTWPDLTSCLSKVVRLLVCVFMVKISLNFNKVCFMPYSTTLSIKKQTLPDKT